MELRKGTVKSFNSGSYKATIQVAGSLATWLQNVPVARNIPATEMVADRSCAVLLFDPANPAGAVVMAVYT
jgi:hypothetical protein